MTSTPGITVSSAATRAGRTTSSPVADAVIGYVHGGTVRAEFTASLLAVCMEGQTRIRTVVALESGPNISTGRNLIVREFLDGNLAPWLLMADTDMSFAADTADRLIAAADPQDRPVVGALYFSMSGGQKYPTMYELVEGAPGGLAFRRYREWPDDACVRVSAIGAPLALMGEDLTFCLRAGAAGIPVHVHTGVKVGHMKTTMLI